jgi:hypothetical protein
MAAMASARGSTGIGLHYSASDPFSDLGDDGVAVSSKSVQPGGKPISHPENSAVGKRPHTRSIWTTIE